LAGAIKNQGLANQSVSVGNGAHGHQNPKKIKIIKDEARHSDG
jgi:hypothetical protein